MKAQEKEEWSCVSTMPGALYVTIGSLTMLMLVSFASSLVDLPEKVWQSGKS